MKPLNNAKKSLWLLLEFWAIKTVCLLCLVNIEPRSMSMGSSPYVTTKDSSKTHGSNKECKNESNSKNQIIASVNNTVINNGSKVDVGR